VRREHVCERKRSTEGQVARGDLGDVGSIGTMGTMGSVGFVGSSAARGVGAVGTPLAVLTVVALLVLVASLWWVAVAHAWRALWRRYIVIWWRGERWVGHWRPLRAALAAEALQRHLLAPAEYRQVRRKGYLEVASSGHPGRVYRVPRGGAWWQWWRTGAWWSGCACSRWSTCRQGRRCWCTNC
jgi:hypothetical protein